MILDKGYCCDNDNDNDNDNNTNQNNNHDDDGNNSSTSSNSFHSKLSIIKLMIDCPGCNDVIFRSGRTTIIHPGNVMFRSMVESISDKHTECSRLGKKSRVSGLYGCGQSRQRTVSDMGQDRLVEGN